jgi:hypothetical protein
MPPFSGSLILTTATVSRDWGQGQGQGLSCKFRNAARLHEIEGEKKCKFNVEKLIWKTLLIASHEKVLCSLT